MARFIFSVTIHYVFDLFLEVVTQPDHTKIQMVFRTVLTKNKKTTYDSHLLPVCPNANYSGIKFMLCCSIRNSVEL